MRRFRSGPRSRRGAGPVVQSFKKVIKYAGASFGAGFNSQFIATGKDSQTAEQTGPTDVDCPTGCIIKYIEIQTAQHVGAANAAVYVNATIQYKLDGQAFIDPQTVGGAKQRNQVLHMQLFNVGHDQNSTRVYRFKVPKQFQRLKVGMSWAFVWATDTTIGQSSQIIYKFYR